MRKRAHFALACLGGTLVFAGTMAACGSRTGLPVLPEETFDAGVAGDVFVSGDRFVPDRFLAEEPDALGKDATEELPMIDAYRPDAPVYNPCPDAAATLIYVIGTAHNTLYSYDPPTATFTTIGTISCPRSGNSAPFSMAVDREGVAYVEFALNAQNPVLGANLYRVSTKTASCAETRYDPIANGRVTYGMGFVANAGEEGDGGETLFIAQQPHDQTANNVLATIDTNTFEVHPVGTFWPESPGVRNAELTGTGDGRLFAFYDDNSDGGSLFPASIIGQIHPTTAQVFSADTLALAQGRGWAFGFWGGDFYTFTAPDATHSVVKRFDPVSLALVPQASIDDVIVGAGVSTCAPSQ